MKKFLFPVLISINLIATNGTSLKARYQQCKASCQGAQHCAACTGDCQRIYCRATCYHKNNQFKQSAACKEFYDCKIEKGTNCNPKPCLNQSKKQKKCLNECNLIYDLSIEKPEQQDSCKECYCFKEDTTEFLGKAACQGECTSCDIRCQEKFKKHKDHGLKGICK